MSDESDDLLKQLDEAVARNKQISVRPKHNEQSNLPRNQQTIKEKKLFPKIYLPLIVIAFIAFFLFSSPSVIVLNQQGNVIGFINELKEAVQGRSFWQGQEKAIIKKIIYLERQPVEDAKFEREIAMLEKEMRQDDERIYKDHPDMRPSVAEQKVQKLRDQADAIEDQQLKNEIEKYRLSELSELNALLRIVKKKISNSQRD